MQNWKDFGHTQNYVARKRDVIVNYAIIFQIVVLLDWCVDSFILTMDYILLSYFLLRYFYLFNSPSYGI